MRDIMKILQQAQEMQGRMAKIQEELQAMTLTGTEDLVAVAAADAQRKAQERQQEQMSALTGGMNLPFKLPFG
jgi:DNA-binding protein YbaB